MRTVEDVLKPPSRLYALVDQYLGWGRERACFSAIWLHLFYGFCFEEVSLPLGTWDELRYLIVALPGPSINYLMTFFKPQPFFKNFSLTPSISLRSEPPRCDKGEQQSLLP